MPKTALPVLELIRIGEINIVNPRQRDAAGHTVIVDNIKSVGLKRPITVIRRKQHDGKGKYDLVCGQGRVEAFSKLGEQFIQAVIIDASAEDGLLMSLVENVARRHRSSIETMREIAALRGRGHTHEVIAQLIGSTPSWVTGVLGLLENGEDRLVASVASGEMPMALAIKIARGNSHDLQAALAEAYETGVLRGKQLAIVRRVIKLRESTKFLRTSSAVSNTTNTRSWSPEELLKLYESEAEAKRVIVKKAELVQSLLAFTVEAFRQMLRDKDFASALKAERLSDMPAALGKLLAPPAEVLS